MKSIGHTLLEGIKNNPSKSKMKIFCIGFIIGTIASWAYILAGGDYWLFIPLWAEIIFYPGLLVGNFCYNLFGSEPLAVFFGTLSVGFFYGVLFEFVHILWKFGTKGGK